MLPQLFSASLSGVVKIPGGALGVTPHSPRSKMACTRCERTWSLLNGYKKHSEPSEIASIDSLDAQMKASVFGSKSLISNVATRNRRIEFKTHTRAAFIKKTATINSDGPHLKKNFTMKTAFQKAGTQIFLTDNLKISQDMSFEMSSSKNSC